MDHQSSNDDGVTLSSKELLEIVLQKEEGGSVASTDVETGIILSSASSRLPTVLSSTLNLRRQQRQRSPLPPKLVKRRQEPSSTHPHPGAFRYSSARDAHDDRSADGSEQQQIPVEAFLVEARAATEEQHHPATTHPQQPHNNESSTITARSDSVYAAEPLHTKSHRDHTFGVVLTLCGVGCLVVSVVLISVLLLSTAERGQVSVSPFVEEEPSILSIVTPHRVVFGGSTDPTANVTSRLQTHGTDTDTPCEHIQQYVHLRLTCSQQGDRKGSTLHPQFVGAMIEHNSNDWMEGAHEWIGLLPFGLVDQVSFTCECRQDRCRGRVTNGAAARAKVSRAWSITMSESSSEDGCSSSLPSSSNTTSSSSTNAKTTFVADDDPEDAALFVQFSDLCPNNTAEHITEEENCARADVVVDQRLCMVATEMVVNEARRELTDVIGKDYDKCATRTLLDADDEDDKPTSSYLTELAPGQLEDVFETFLTTMFLEERQ